MNNNRIYKKQRTVAVPRPRNEDQFNFRRESAFLVPTCVLCTENKTLGTLRNLKRHLLEVHSVSRSGLKNLIAPYCAQRLAAVKTKSMETYAIRCQPLQVMTLTSKRQ